MQTTLGSLSPPFGLCPMLSLSVLPSCAAPLCWAPEEIPHAASFALLSNVPSVLHPIALQIFDHAKKCNNADVYLTLQKMSSLGDNWKHR